MPQALRDSVALQTTLQSGGFELDSVLSRNGQHIALTAHRDDGGVHVAVLQREANGFVLLGSDPLLENIRPQRVSWLKLDEHQGFSYTHDIPAEGVVGTVVRTIERDSLRLTYVDPGICRPAELRDLDGDGTPELISYPEEASGGDCSSECHLQLRSHFDGGPHWTSVQRWDDGQWVLAEAAFPDFYANVAAGFRRMQRWASGDETTCTDRWMNADPFARWAERAENLASSP